METVNTRIADQTEVSSKGNTRRFLSFWLTGKLQENLGPGLFQPQISSFLNDTAIETLESYNSNFRLCLSEFNKINRGIYASEPLSREFLSNDQLHGFLVRQIIGFGFPRTKFDLPKAIEAFVNSVGFEARQRYLDEPHLSLVAFRGYFAKFYTGKVLGIPKNTPRQRVNQIPNYCGMDNSQAGAAPPQENQTSANASSSSSSSSSSQVVIPPVVQEAIPSVIYVDEGPDREEETGLYELTNSEERQRVASLLVVFSPYNILDLDAYKTFIKTKGIEVLIDLLNKNLKPEQPYSRTLRPPPPPPAPELAAADQEVVSSSSSAQPTVKQRKPVVNKSGVGKGAQQNQTNVNKGIVIGKDQQSKPKVQAIDLANDDDDNDDSNYSPSESESEDDNEDQEEDQVGEGGPDQELETEGEPPLKVQKTSHKGSGKSRGPKKTVIPSASSSAGSEANEAYRKQQAAAAGKAIPYSSVSEFSAKNGKQGETLVVRKPTDQPRDTVPDHLIDRFAVHEEKINQLAQLHHLEDTREHGIDPARHPCTSCRRVFRRIHDNATNDCRTWYFCEGCSNLTEGQIYFCCPKCACDHAFSKCKHMLLLEAYRELAELEPTAGAEDGFTVKKEKAKKANKKKD